MSSGPYPYLPYDPCPGDLPGYQAMATYTGRSAGTLAEAVALLASAGSPDWRGETANAFRVHVRDDVLPLASKAVSAIGHAATALTGWSGTLAALQDEAQALNRQAAPYWNELSALNGIKARAALNPVFANEPVLTRSQQLRFDEATSVLDAISATVDEVYSRYLAAVQRTGDQLQSAGNMAPRPSPWYDDFAHSVEHGWDDITHGLDVFVHDKALLEEISEIANLVGAVAAVLGCIPGLEWLEVVAAAADMVELASDTLLAIFDHGSWTAVAFDSLPGSGLVGDSLEIDPISRKVGSDIFHAVSTWWEKDFWDQAHWRGIVIGGNSKNPAVRAGML